MCAYLCACVRMCARPCGSTVMMAESSKFWTPVQKDNESITGCSLAIKKLTVHSSFPTYNALVATVSGDMSRDIDSADMSLWQKVIIFSSRFVIFRIIL